MLEIVGRLLDWAVDNRPSARTGLDGLSVVTVLESALRAELALDPTYRTLAPRRFRDEVLDLSTRVLGPPEVA